MGKLPAAPVQLVIRLRETARKTPQGRRNRGTDPKNCHQGSGTARVRHTVGGTATRAGGPGRAESGSRLNIVVGSDRAVCSVMPSAVQARSAKQGQHPANSWYMSPTIQSGQCGNLSRNRCSRCRLRRSGCHRTESRCTPKSGYMSYMFPTRRWDHPSRNCCSRGLE